MKKILFFAIFVLVFGIARSQVFQDVQDHTRLTEVYIDNTNLQGYTQKVLPYTKEQHIALTKTSEGRNKFVLLKNESTETVESIEIGGPFEVKDFDVFQEKLYFCGSYNNNGNDEAFLAYTDIDAFFQNTSSSNLTFSSFKYTLINNIYQDSIFSIDRIEVFKDTNDIVVAGIGKMYYGVPPYQVLEPSPFGGAELVLKDPIEYYLDFFMLYTIKEDTVVTNQYDVALGDTATYGIANKFEMFYVPSDTVSHCYFNKFADITESENKIYLTSVNYSNTNAYDSTIHASFIDLISFDKITRQQTAGRLYLPFYLHQSDGVKTTPVAYDKIAIVFSGCYFQHNSHTCALMVSPDSTNIYELSNISVFDSLEYGFRIRDCEFLNRERELVVLKSSVFNNEKMDVVFHLQMNYDTTTPYTHYKYRINNKNNKDLRCSDLSKFNDKDYTVAGSGLNNNMFIYDTKNTAYLLEGPCFEKQEYEITRLNSFPVAPIPTLIQGRYSKQVPSVDNMQLHIWYSSVYVYNAIVKTRGFLGKKSGKLNTECLE